MLCEEEHTMSCNVGGFDRIARVVAGLAVLIVGGHFKSWWGLLGLVPLLTGIIGFCPIYLPLRISSCRK
jgi:hypothetical protein